MFCAYHGEDHPPETPFNVEHVVPYSLGGSNQFTIQVCSKVNSDLGSEIDARFQRIFPVAYQRFIRNLKSYSGAEPTILFRGTTELDGKTLKIEYEITQSEKSLVMVPSIEREDRKEGIRYQVQSSRDDFQKMLRNIQRKYPGKQMVDDAGNPVNTEELLARAQTTVPTIRCDWDPDEWSVAAQKEFVKIGLGAAHFLLGETYSRSSAADGLRKFLSAKDAELPLLPIRGQIWPNPTVANLHFLYRGATPDQHLVTLLHLDQRLTVFINLFGEIRGLIQIADDPAICQVVPPNDGFVLTIDPSARTLRRRTFQECLVAIS